MPFDKSKTVYNASYNKTSEILATNQSGAAEAWWAHNPQVPGSKPGSDKREKLPTLCFLAYFLVVTCNCLIGTMTA